MSSASTRTDNALHSHVNVRSPHLLVADGANAGATFAAADTHRLLSEGALWRPRTPSVVVYQVISGEHQQTGVVVEVSVADYRAGRVRPHEATDPDRVRKLIDYTTTARLEHSPVMLTHTPRDGLRDMLATVTTTEPAIDLRDATHTHRVWVAYGDAFLRAVWEELEALNTLYIADGHHRMASADRYSARYGEPAQDDPAGYTLGVLFPSDEMRIFGYPRCVERPADWSTEKLITALATAPGAAGITECAPMDAASPVPDSAAVFVDGQWYRLWLREETVGLRASLACVRMDENVIRPLFGGDRWATTPGTYESAALAEWCTVRETIGFLPYPPSVEQVMAISDANSVMPPKSTWFHPKAPQGLFARELA